ncbi:MAG: toprim domain-containing protein, partial [Spirochaetales bacterium]|nr:toprim domain-containing protein [Spirochaetales bacterium]
DDKNPSLSVEQEKGFYNCFGCGESGDVFDLVKVVKGFSFTESLAFLKEYAGSGNNKTHRAVEEYTNRKTGAQPLPSGSALTVTALGKKKDLPVEGPFKNKEPAGKVNKEELSGITLDTVAEHYKKSLLKSPAANSYLKSRGFTDFKLYERLGLGFADGSLPAMLSEKQKEELKASGILNKKGAEHFAGHITIPLFDEAGRAQSFYGRAINNSKKIKHLYSPGEHKGLVNRKAAAVYREEIILTESVLDALSLIQIGIENVIPCYGVNGFTDEHISLLGDERVKTVVIAFDADIAGRNGSEKLKSKLTSEGFSVKIIEPPAGKDWNEGLIKGFKKEEITTILHQSEVFKMETEVTEDFTAKKEGQKYLFTTSGVSYRLLGVKEMFVSTLRVNIRAEKEDETDSSKYLDNVDLYSARSRALFAGQLSHVLNLETVRIEKDLIKIVEYLETERDRKLLTNEDEVPELTEEEKQLGMGFLTDPAIFERLVSDTETLGYVGEAINKQLIYLAASSRKLPDPISVIVVSQSAAGKSYLIDTVKKLIPTEEVVSMTSLSDQALNYLADDALLNKFLVMGEAVHSEAVEHQVREMLSAHELSRLVTMKDPKTGELRSRMVRKEVIVSAVMSTTNGNINPENASRSFVVNTDESETQTRAIHASQRKKYSVERFTEKESLIPQIIKTHFAAQRLLIPRTIVNPFAEVIDFPSALMRSRRDHERFIDLISSVCFLRQFQKEEKQTKEGVTFIECDLGDYKVAYEIMTHILPSTLTSFPKSALELYEIVREVIKKKAKEDSLLPVEVSVTQRELREATGMNQMFVKRNMRILRDYEYVTSFGSPGARSRKSYRLVADEAIRLIDLSIIPTPGEIKARVKL